jgi:uncharacterized membrane protein
MKAFFLQLTEVVALGLEATSIGLIAFGAACAILSFGRRRGAGPSHAPQTAFLKLGRWLLLALEFTLAADVVRTAIAPTWDDIGQLAAIAVIRTFLNFFLERDLARTAAEDHPAAAE